MPYRSTESNTHFFIVKVEELCKNKFSKFFKSRSFLCVKMLEKDGKTIKPVQGCCSFPSHPDQPLLRSAQVLPKILNLSTF